MQNSISSVPAQYVRHCKEKNGELFKANSYTDISEAIIEKIAMCKAWEKSQATYVFSKKLSDELYNRTGSIDEIPCSALHGIPCDCYVHLGRTALYGYFVSKRHIYYSDNPNIKSELLILPIDSNMYAKYAFKLPIIENATIGEAKKQTAQDNLTSLKSFGLRIYDDAENHVMKEYETNLSKIINQILYICCENADIKKKQDEPKTWEIGFSDGDKIEVKKRTKTGKKLPYAKRCYFKVKLSDSSDYPLLFWFPPIFSDEIKL